MLLMVKTAVAKRVNSTRDENTNGDKRTNSCSTGFAVEVGIEVAIDIVLALACILPNESIPVCIGCMPCICMVCIPMPVCIDVPIVPICDGIVCIALIEVGVIAIVVDAELTGPWFTTPNTVAAI